MAAMVRYTFEPLGITTRPFLSFTSDDTVPVSFCPALWVRELMPASNLAAMAVPEERIPVAALTVVFAAGLGATLLVDFAEDLLLRSPSGELASTAGRCRSRFGLSVAAEPSWSPPHPSRRASARYTSRLPAMLPPQNYWTGLPSGCRRTPEGQFQGQFLVTSVSGKAKAQAVSRNRK